MTLTAMMTATQESFSIQNCGINKGMANLAENGHNNHEDDIMLEPLCHLEVLRNVTRQDSVSESEIGSPSQDYSIKFFSVVMGEKRKRQEDLDRHKRNMLAWRHALVKIKCRGDVWQKFNMDDFPTEKAFRYRYNALRKEWVKDEVVTKMEPISFSHGAMRECYRLKKLSNFTHGQDWHRDSTNCVAKCYMGVEVDRNMYFEEVKLQMDAKLWADEYDRHNPPKKVDIMQMAVLEYYERPGKPLFHVENFIEGDYVKYNSNSGYVDDHVLRQTPHAFSHFTFEQSGHELIVVDVQGVGDLYTDPQIHTAAGTEYGDGNLGTRGMALFFHSHVCNRICESLGLSRFDLAPAEESELSCLATKQKLSKTVTRGKEEIVVFPNEYERTHLHDFLRMRSSSSIGSASSSISESPIEINVEEVELEEDDSTGGIEFRARYDSGMGDSEKRSRISSGSASRMPRRRRLMTECLPGSTVTREQDRMAFRDMVQQKSRPSCIHAEMEFRNLSTDKRGGSILGEVHLQVAKYHELQRFTVPGVDGYDHTAALFHLRTAAQLGILEAIITMARIGLHLPHDVLPDLTVEDTPDNTDMGVDFMIQAAQAGDRHAMVYLAKGFDTGVGIGTRSKSWKEAIRWYQAAGEEGEDESGHYDGTMDDPNYQLLARQAEIYAEGGFGVEKDVPEAVEMYTSAADEAMALMKGRVANKYYALAEELSGQMEE